MLYKILKYAKNKMKKKVKQCFSIKHFFHLFTLISLKYVTKINFLKYYNIKYLE